MKIERKTDWAKVVEFGLLGAALVVAGAYIAYKCDFTGIVADAAFIVVVIGLLFVTFFMGSLLSLIPLPWWIGSVLCFAIDLLKAHADDCPDWEYSTDISSFVDSIGGDTAMVIVFWAAVLFLCAAMEQHDRKKAGGQ